MKVKKEMLLLSVSLILSSVVIAQNNINYKHKSLLKELSKAGVTNLSEIKEINLSDSVCKSNRINGKYFLIKNNVNQYQYIYIGRVNSCRAGGCSISNEIPNKGNFEYFDYFILFDKTKTVQFVKVFNYQATHGQEITAKSWLKQFIGHNDSQVLEVNKNIDAISGATISVYAITDDVEIKTLLLNEL